RSPTRREHLGGNGRHIQSAECVSSERGAGACFSAEVPPLRIMGSPSLPAPMITTFELPLRANSFVASIPFHFNRFSLIPSVTIFENCPLSPSPHWSELTFGELAPKDSPDASLKATLPLEHSRKDRQPRHVRR